MGRDVERNVRAERGERERQRQRQRSTERKAKGWERWGSNVRGGEQREGGGVKSRDI